MVFLFGLFWKRTTTNAALAAVFLAIPLSLFLKFTLAEMAFIHRMGLSFVILSAIVVGISMMESKTDSPKAIELRKGLFDTDKTFNFWALVVIALLVLIYTVFY